MKTVLIVWLSFNNGFDYYQEFPKQIGTISEIYAANICETARIRLLNMWTGKEGVTIKKLECE